MIFKKVWRLWQTPKPRQSRQIKLFSQGNCYNLKEIFDLLNQEYFDQKLDLSITWFGSADRAARRRRLLGAYSDRDKLIKVHRLLDSEHFPPYFISFIVYHEMLHHVVPPQKQKNGRRKVHHEAFKDRERQFKDYALAEKWQKDNLSSFFKGASKQGIGYGRS